MNFVNLLVIPKRKIMVYKMGNDYGAIKFVLFFNIALGQCHLCFIFGISSLILFFIAFSKVIALETIATAIVFDLSYLRSDIATALKCEIVAIVGRAVNK